MDGVKLEAWKCAFEQGVRQLQVSYDALYLPQQLQEAYKLEADETGQTLVLTIDPSMPAAMQDRMEKLLLESKPEDSV